MSTRLQKQATLELEELLSIVGFDTADGKISFELDPPCRFHEDGQKIAEQYSITPSCSKVTSWDNARDAAKQDVGNGNILKQHCGNKDSGNLVNKTLPMTNGRFQWQCLEAAAMRARSCPDPTTPQKRNMNVFAEDVTPTKRAKPAC